MHSFIRTESKERRAANGGRSVRVLYGGSVKADNAAPILATDNVDGALLGGASLKPGDFIGIARAAE